MDTAAEQYARVAQARQTQKAQLGTA